MNTYPTTTLSKPVRAERVPKGTFGYFRTRNRHRLYSMIIKEFKKSGLTQADLARRLGKSPEIVCRLLATPGNLQVDTLSDLLFAISGAESTYELSYPLDKLARNDTRPEWLADPQTDRKSVGTPKPNVQRGATSAAEANEQSTRPPPIDRNVTNRPGRTFQSAAHQRERAITSSGSLLETNA